MILADYQEAFALISSWRGGDLREAQLEELKASDRRANVLLAMVLIAALLSKVTDVEEGFVEQLTAVTDANFAEGLLNITDQILQAVDADDTQDTEAADELLAVIPETFAFWDIAGHEADQ